ncbi:hypothetical protein [Polaromonas sp. YR568]|uniref:hypothetical protein n=1 Tax=Polaromonas sp. YR568 TaxID=1855301 RepID=UPI00398BC908
MTFQSSTNNPPAPYRAATVKALGLAMLLAGFALQAAAATQGADPAAASPSPAAASGTAGNANPAAQADHPRHADFGRESASREAAQVAHWVVASADNQGMPFLIIDKVNAKVFVFDARGHLSGAAPALLGLARGDDSTPGIGERKLSTIRPEERTTPAGRFVASLGQDLHGAEMLWIDYDTAISLHRVLNVAGERRAQRIESATPSDNRISYGCINVPVKFYDKVVSPAFTGTSGIVYILPETRPAREVFKSFDVDEQAPAQGAG